MRPMSAAVPTDASDALQPRAPGQRRPISLVDVELDPAQRGAVSLPAGRALLVLGEAGHGKTTVALHRVAHLWRSAAGPKPPRMAVVVPTEGLARLLQPLLRRLGIDVEAQTYDRWAAAQARRLFRDVPRRESEGGSPLVARLKRDPAVRVALEELGLRAPGTIDDDPDARQRRSRARVRRADLQHLFGDRLLLESVARASGAITAPMIDAVFDHTRVQFSQTAEEEWAHVTDRRRLVAIDDRRLDEGTATGDAGTVDVEDYAVLVELDRIRAAYEGRQPAGLRLHDVIAIDEAQDLAPLELAMLRRGLAPGGTLVVAGDADQQTDPTSAFFGWEATMAELGAPDAAVVHLDVGYRCPPGIARLARTLRGSQPRSAALARGAAGEPQAALPALLAFASEVVLADALGSPIAALQERDPTASVAIVCRAPSTVQRLAVAFRRILPVRVVFDGRFLPRGPAQITVVEEVKGLEFDFVVVPDATESQYPDTAASRRALYVAATRARHQLLFACAGPPTRLLASLLIGPPIGDGDRRR
jgi:superfamily I DNA/RNA helicase